MTLWPDKKTAEDHLADLKRVRESLPEDANKNRVKTIDSLIEKTEKEIKGVHEAPQEHFK
jgi:F0F1-type ATP synthase membrane subunit b/b'